jgi:O-antigen ligase
MPGFFSAVLTRAWRLEIRRRIKSYNANLARARRSQGGHDLNPDFISSPMRARLPALYRLPTEVWLLASLAFVLPTMEMPKNVLFGVWVIAWFLSRLKDGDWGGKWNIWDTLILAWIGSFLLSATFPGVTHGEWRGSRDVARYTTVLWLLTRSNYDEDAWKLIYGALMLSVIVATGWAIAALAWPHDYLGIQLNSVGHVNDSMTYVAICFGALLGALAIYWRSLWWLVRVDGVVGIVILVGAVAFAGSRAAAVSVMVLALSFGTLWLRRSRSFFRGALLGAIVFASLIVGLDTEIWRKQEWISETSHPVLGARYPIWNQAVLEWRMYPLLGIGNTNFAQLRDDEAERWLVSRGEPYSDSTYAGSSHAHSLYLNTLAERGLVGAASLLALLGGFLTSLIRGMPRTRDPTLHWLLWCGASSAFLVTAGIGLVNTTLHSETALLAAILIGAWIGYRRRTRAVARAEAGAGRRAPADDLKVAQRATL